MQETNEKKKLLTSSGDMTGVIGKALAHQQSLERTIDSLLKAAEDSEFSKAALVSTLKSVHADVLALGSLFSDNLDSTFYNAKLPPGAVSNAMKVFGVPELLEECLDYLDIADLLRFEQTCKAMRDTVRSSSKLARDFFHQSKDGDPPRALGTIGRCSVGSGTYPIDIYFHKDTDKRWEEVGKAYNWHASSKPLMRAKVRGPGHLLPAMGERGRDRLIFHPPIKTMVISTNCCGEDLMESDYPLEELVGNRNGLTLGNLYDAAEDKINSHRSCDDAEVVVSFRGLRAGEVSYLQGGFWARYVCAEDLAEYGLTNSD
ncbi:hypothetical protein LTR85_008339 [Meristemomyces frigidus]|nr:hypothetical protein LTR85_008339 [Meristemomyces frigidus]